MLFILVALPFVLIPAALILIELSAFYLVELVVWGPLRAGAGARKRVPRKEVNRPRFEWKLS